MSSAAAVELRIARFGGDHPTPFEATEVTWITRLRAWRIRWKADRLQSQWKRRHGGMKRSTALDFAFSDVSGGLRVHRFGNRYDFIDLAMERHGLRPCPSGESLRRWATAYVLADPPETCP